MNVPVIKDKCLGYSGGLLLMNKLGDMYKWNCSLITSTNRKEKVIVMIWLLTSWRGTVSKLNYINSEPFAYIFQILPVWILSNKFHEFPGQSYTHALSNSPFYFSRNRAKYPSLVMKYQIWAGWVFKTIAGLYGNHEFLFALNSDFWISMLPHSNEHYFP